MAFLKILKCIFKRKTPTDLTVMSINLITDRLMWMHGTNRLCQAGLYDADEPYDMDALITRIEQLLKEEHRHAIIKGNSGDD